MGTRNCSQAGLQFTQALVELLVKSDYTIVSGLARGIDSIAHRSTLKHKGKTIAILPWLPDIYPPEHKILSEEITENGTVVSEIMGGKSGAYAFIRRNELIAAVSQATIAIEGGPNSGTKYAPTYGHKMNKLVIIPELSYTQKNNPRYKELKDGFLKLKDSHAIVVGHPNEIIDILDINSLLTNNQIKPLDQLREEYKDNKTIKNTNAETPYKKLMQQKEYQASLTTQTNTQNTTKPKPKKPTTIDDFNA